jgi:hypothetical protein
MGKEKREETDAGQVAPNSEQIARDLAQINHVSIQRSKRDLRTLKVPDLRPRCQPVYPEVRALIAQPRRKGTMGRTC